MRVLPKKALYPFGTAPQLFTPKIITIFKKYVKKNQWVLKLDKYPVSIP